ncbi:hypothetical protein AG1IA_05247 [Rhizoctonia solani AG-1 IA]|uniref:Uncharacterized protein n=1 Tax=Thanatephorus cucumeris (strain AG1-IA) TaxID=983506 RepID=L8WVC5_THACA|nr:hypothetical protein AG1IA_05247 [Rhizoctonia solani AG-1 IA]
MLPGLPLSEQLAGAKTKISPSRNALSTSLLFWALAINAGEMPPPLHQNAHLGREVTHGVIPATLHVLALPLHLSKPVRSPLKSPINQQYTHAGVSWGLTLGLGVDLLSRNYRADNTLWPGSTISKGDFSIRRAADSFQGHQLCRHRQHHLSEVGETEEPGWFVFLLSKEALARSIFFYTVFDISRKSLGAQSDLEWTHAQCLQTLVRMRWIIAVFKGLEFPRVEHYIEVAHCYKAQFIHSFYFMTNNETTSDHQASNRAAGIDLPGTGNRVHKTFRPLAGRVRCGENAWMLELVVLDRPGCSLPRFTTDNRLVRNELQVHCPSSVRDKKILGQQTNNDRHNRFANKFTCARVQGEAHRYGILRLEESSTDETGETGNAKRSLGDHRSRVGVVGRGGSRSRCGTSNRGSRPDSAGRGSTTGG